VATSAGSAWRLGELLGVAEQRRHAVADQRRRRLVAGDVEGDQLGDQLLVGEALAVDLGLHELGEEVVGRLGPLRLRHGQQVVLHLGQQVHALLVVGGGLGDVEAPGDGVRPLPEARAGFVGHAEHLAEHGDGQRVGEVADQLHAAPVDQLVEGAGHPLLHRGPDAFDGAGGERRLQQAPQAGVVGVVAEHQGEDLVAPLPLAGSLEVDHRRRRGPVEIAADGRVAEHRADVVEAGEHPPAQQLGAVDGVVLAQAPVLVVGPGVEAGLERIERGHAPPPSRVRRDPARFTRTGVTARRRPGGPGARAGPRRRRRSG
jgi:hypothetical protein